MKKSALHLLLSFSKTSEKLIKEAYEIPFDSAASNISVYRKHFFKSYKT